MSLIDSSLGYSDRGNQNSLIPLVVILGPTAVGKTEIAIQLAERFTGEIVSADSRLFYCGMDIGTAKPSLEDRRRIAHHLIDVANPDETWSLSLFQNEANIAIQNIHSIHHLPFLVGGTGQFIRSIIEGWKTPSVEPDLRLREALARWSDIIGPDQLHKRLAIVDPAAATAIQPSNVRRTIRALEVIFTTGHQFSLQRATGHSLYNTLIMGITCPRAELYHRIDERISSMIDAGFIDEVARLLAQGYSADLPTMSAIGYREIAACIQGRISIDEAIVLMKRRTREFVRRQANWFKLTDPRIHWFQRGTSTLDDMGKMIAAWLTT
jgi:tRNA dimethylallyltransferase